MRQVFTAPKTVPRDYQTRLLPKPNLSGYVIHELIGMGAGSLIYRATETESGRMVAIKHVTPEVIRQRMADVRNAPPVQEPIPVDLRSFYEQLKREYDVCRGIGRTPFRHRAPEVYKLKPIRRFLFETVGYDLLMEFIPGKTLRQNRDYAIREFARFYYETAEFLHGMHCLNLIHGDIKPQHLIVTPYQELKVLDFGLCRALGSTSTRLQGTPDYMAPEQAWGLRVDARTDIYCLGVSFYWVLTGRTKSAPVMSLISASVGDLNLSVERSPCRIRDINPRVPEKLERLVMDSCQPRMEDRPNSMLDVMERLHPLLGHS